jgi:hypothetical protein
VCIVNLPKRKRGRFEEPVEGAALGAVVLEPVGAPASAGR